LVEDCIHRDGNKCKKTGESIAIDARDPDNLLCWKKKFCDYYKKDMEEKEEEIEIENIENKGEGEKKDEEKVEETKQKRGDGILEQETLF